MTSAIFLLNLYNKQTDDVWMPSDPGPYLVPYDPPFQSVLLALDVSKGAASDGIPFVILKISFFFNMSLCRHVFSRQVEVFLRDIDIQEKQAQKCKG
jgi:hypothetical protein